MRGGEMKRKYLTSLVTIVLFALSGCGSQAEYPEYYEETIPEYTAIGISAEDITEHASTEIPPEVLMADEAETTTPLSAMDISLPIHEVFERDGLIHLLANDARYGSRHGLLDSTGNIIVPFRTGITFGEHSEGLIFAATARGSGFIDTTTGEWAIEPNFTFSLNPRSSNVVFRYGVAVLALDDGRVGVINRDGDWVIEPDSRRMGTQFHYGLNTIHQDGQEFIINTAGERVFPLEHMEIYDTGRSFRVEGYNLIKVGVGGYRRFNVEDNTPIWVDGYTKFFDLEGNLIGYIEDYFPVTQYTRNGNEYYFHHRYLDIYMLDGMVIAHAHNTPCQVMVDSSMQFRVFDIQGNKVSNHYYTSIGRFWEGFAPVEIGHPSWQMDESESWVEIYDWDNVFWGLIDAQGNEVIPLVHWHVSNVINGLVQVYSPRGFAVLNTAGEYIIPFGQFNNFIICDQGIVIAGVAVGGTPPSDQLKGLIDLEGNEIIPPRYNIIRNYRTQNRRILWEWELILMQTGVYSPARWGWDLSQIHGGVYSQTFVEGRAAVAYDGLWGYVDMNGYEVIPLQFMYAGTFIDGMALVNVGGTRARPHTWQHSDWWENYIPNARHYSAFGGTWHLIDLYGNILETFEHEFVKRVSANVLAFSNDISLSEVYDAHASDRRIPPFVGGRYSLLWNEDGFIGHPVVECIYITLVQMNFGNFGIIVIE